jgi:hypothetical protein
MGLRGKKGYAFSSSTPQGANCTGERKMCNSVTDEVKDNAAIG